MLKRTTDNLFVLEAVSKIQWNQVNLYPIISHVALCRVSSLYIQY